MDERLATIQACRDSHTAVTSYTTNTVYSTIPSSSSHTNGAICADDLIDEDEPFLFKKNNWQKF